MHFVEPVAGELACKTVGTGKLEDVENVVRQALELLEGEKGRKGEGGIFCDAENLARRDSMTAFRANLPLSLSPLLPFSTNEPSYHGQDTFRPHH